MDDRGLPEPSAELILIGALIMELSEKKYDLSERVLARIQAQQTRRTVALLRGPKLSVGALAAMDQAEAWAGQATIAVKVLKRG